MRYFINLKKQPETAGGNYEIHKETCIYYILYKSHKNFVSLGIRDDEFDALNFAKIAHNEIMEDIDGCKHCCPLIHNH